MRAGEAPATFWRRQLYGLTLQSNRRLEGWSVASSGSPAAGVEVEFVGADASAIGSPAERVLTEVKCTTEHHGSFGSRVTTWDDRGGNHVRLHFFGSGNHVDFVVGPARDRVRVRWNNAALFEDVQALFRGPVLSALLRLRGDTCLHASVISCDGGACALLGPSGAGKSTTAAALTRRGFTVCLDVGERVHSRIGFECVVAVDPEWQSGWPRFLDRFVADGVCAAEKRDALRHWRGVRLPWTTSDEWPSYLVAESLLRAPDRVGIIRRWHSHLKVDHRPGEPSVVKAYLGFGHWWVRPGSAEKGVLRLPADDPRAATPTSAQAYRDQVRAYYDRTNAEYLVHLGATFQAELVTTEDGDPATSNRQLATWAGIRPGDRILDAGCGVAGPAVDIAGAIEALTIDGITISPAQARTARARVAAAGLSERVRVCVGDYHDLPYGAGAFDVVTFFESSGYSDDRGRLFREVLRVLRPGGTLYIKDAFRREGPLSPADARGLADFDRLYAHRTPVLAETVALLERIGFQAVCARDLSTLVDKRHWTQAIGEPSATAELTPFGELHFHGYESLPVFTGAQLRHLRAAPELIAGAIEELLRYDPPGQLLWRSAREDVELGGKRIRRGQFVRLLIGAANRDPARFPDPDRLDIERQPNRHLAFGAGIHHCLGAGLARLEAAVGINALLRRFPNLALAAEPDWVEGFRLRGPRTLMLVV